MDDTPTVASPAPSPAPSQSAAPSPWPSPVVSGATLSVTPEQFRAAWNQAAVDLDTPALQLGALEMSQGAAASTFTVMLSDNVGVMGTMDAGAEELSNVIVMTQSSERASGNTLAIGAWAALTMAMSPDLDPDGRSSVLEELGVLDGSFAQPGHEETAVRGEVRYSLSLIEGLGWMMSAEHPDRT